MEDIQLDWFFGIPGSGKDHVAEIFSQMTGIPRYEADAFHTEEDRQAVAESRFTLERRHAQLQRINASLKARKIVRAIITHPLPDRESRALVQTFSDKTRLIHVKTPIDVIRDRLKKRKNHHFTEDLLSAWIPRHWQEPEGENCIVIMNDVSEQSLEEQLRKLTQ